MVEGSMVTPLFAMPPPQMLLVWPVGIALVFLFVRLFVGATARKDRGKKTESDRRAGLGLTAILCGPLVEEPDLCCAQGTCLYPSFR